MENDPAQHPASGSFPPDLAPGQAVVFFDGVCGLCNRFVDDALAADHHKRLRFAPIQGTTFAALVEQHPELAKVDSMVLWQPDSHPGTQPGRLYLHSDASLTTLRLLGGVRGTLASALLCIPHPLRNAVYRLIAATRYRFFGRKTTCRLPTPAERAQFLP